MRATAHTLNILLHPLFMPLLTVVVAFRMDPHISFFMPLAFQLLTFAMVFVLTVLFPLTTTLLLLRSGAITGLSMPHRQERVIPFLMTLFYFTLCYYLLAHRTPQHEATLAMFLGALVALLLTTVITLRWKISVHMVGIGGLLGALTGLLMLHHTFAPLEMALFIVLAGALGTARLLTSDHTPLQVGAGALLGFACTYTCVAHLFFI
ncbi:MAG: hypothetical protein H6595_06620 [Flavobacteriales bacterium]|nr:hypothetical protein [Flavobacteriales bacterium]MCB9167139.1 hypothetical protein [Flavobacteriales bacterium]